RYGAHPEHVMAGMISGQGRVDTTVTSLFTHVITHEFHHKGQIMSMMRLIGYIPPDADIIRF
ncbi:MAG: hypothetical protein EOO92_22520, partial [Pedobacter sp.]